MNSSLTRLRFAALLCAVITFAATSGCGGSGSNESAASSVTDSASVSVYNLLVTGSGTTPNVDLIADKQSVVTNVPYLGLSKKATISWNKGDADIPVRFRVTGDSSSVHYERVTLESGSRKILCLVGQTDTLTEPLRSSLVILGGNSAPPASGKFRVRFLHALPGAGAVDIYLGDKGDERKVVDFLWYKQTTNYIEASAATANQTQSLIITRFGVPPDSATDLIHLTGSSLFSAGKTYLVPLTHTNSNAISPISVQIAEVE